MELAGICAEKPSPEKIRCIGRSMRVDKVFADSPFAARSLCEPDGDRIRGCFNDLVSDHAKVDHTKILQICRMPETSLRGCIQGYFFSDEIQSLPEARDVCGYPEAARACLLGHRKSGLSMLDAKDICSARSSLTRDCLTRFYHGLPPFEGGVVNSTYDAHPICEISNPVDQACVFKVLRKKMLDKASDAVKLCLLGSQERRVCESYVSGLNLFADPIDNETFCAIPNFETRACVYDKMRGYKPLFGIIGPGMPHPEQFLMECAVEFSTNLTAPLDGPAHGIGCEFIH